jgi:hypothetical protein
MSESGKIFLAPNKAICGSCSGRELINVPALCNWSVVAMDWTAQFGRVSYTQYEALLSPLAGEKDLVPGWSPSALVRSDPVVVG